MPYPGTSRWTRKVWQLFHTNGYAKTAITISTLLVKFRLNIFTIQALHWLPFKLYFCHWSKIFKLLWTTHAFIFSDSYFRKKNVESRSGFAKWKIVFICRDLVLHALSLISKMAMKNASKVLKKSNTLWPNTNWCK